MRLFSSWLVLVSLLGTGCTKPEEHPPGIQTHCDSSTNCVKPPVVGGGVKDSGAGDTALSDAQIGDAITGKILVLTGDDFDAAIPLTGAATVFVEGASGLPAEGNYDGTEYSVAGVKIDHPVWATVVPSPSDALPTAQPLDTTATTVFDLVTVPGGTLDLIYSVLNVATTRDPGTAHIVLRFVGANGLPLPGVSVSHLGETVAYDSGGTWTDDSTGTGDQGFAIITNVIPGSKPAKQIFTLTTAAGSQGVELWVEADTVTITDVLIF